jgi:hypothetical protein
MGPPPRIGRTTFGHQDSIRCFQPLPADSNDLGERNLIVYPGLEKDRMAQIV